MGQLLKVIGIGWAVLGALNICSIVWQGASSGSPSPTVSLGLVFNFLVFILPGLVLAGVGALIDRKPTTPQMVVDVADQPKPRTPHRPSAREWTMLTLFAVLGIGTVASAGLILARLFGNKVPHDERPVPSPYHQQVPSDPKGCSTADIEVDRLGGRIAGDWVHVTGSIINKCALPIGVEIKVTMYDASGGIISSKDIWPASIANIPARSDFPFEWMDDVSGFKTFDVRVIRVKKWDDE
jgi:hypothetical protein